MNRVVRGAAQIVVAWCLLVFFYGIVTFIDAPYRPCAAAEGYCGKTGKPHTQEQYEAFTVWERTLLISWPFGMLAGFAIGRMNKQAARGSSAATG